MVPTAVASSPHSMQQGWVSCDGLPPSHLLSGGDLKIRPNVRNSQGWFTKNMMNTLPSGVFRLNHTSKPYECKRRRRKSASLLHCHLPGLLNSEPSLRCTLYLHTCKNNWLLQTLCLLLNQTFFASCSWLMSSLDHFAAVPCPSSYEEAQHLLTVPKVVVSACESR